MSIPLDQFEQIIDGTILQRGSRYYNEGLIDELVEVSPGEYHAVVHGTEDYMVQMVKEGNHITEYRCSCPYDWGPVCKHIAAAFFYLNHAEHGVEEHPKEAPRRKRKSTSRKSVAQQTREVLEAISPDELLDFVERYAADNPSFRHSLTQAFPQYNKQESKAFYAQQVRSILKSAKGRHGFIDWQHVGKVGKSVWQLVGSARDHFQSGNVQSAHFMAFAILEEMCKALQFADDSHADIGDNIRAAVDLLFDMADSALSDEFRARMLQQALKTYRSDVLEGWDWHLDMLALAARLISTKDEAQEVERELNAYMDEADEFSMQTARKIMLLFLEKTTDEQTVQQYIQAHIDDPPIRRNALENAMAAGEYEQVREIAQKGMEFDEHERPGLVTEWREWLLRVAQKLEDTEAIIEQARNLFVGGRRNRMEYYRVLKQWIPADDWRDFLHGLIQDVQQNGGG